MGVHFKGRLGSFLRLRSSIFKQRLGDKRSQLFIRTDNKTLFRRCDVRLEILRRGVQFKTCALKAIRSKRASRKNILAMFLAR